VTVDGSENHARGHVTLRDGRTALGEVSLARSGGRCLGLADEPAVGTQYTERGVRGDERNEGGQWTVPGRRPPTEHTLTSDDNPSSPATA